MKMFTKLRTGKYSLLNTGKIVGPKVITEMMNDRGYDILARSGIAQITGHIAPHLMNSASSFQGSGPADRTKYNEVNAATVSTRNAAWREKWGVKDPLAGKRIIENPEPYRGGAQHFRFIQDPQYEDLARQKGAKIRTNLKGVRKGGGKPSIGQKIAKGIGWLTGKLGMRKTAEGFVPNFKELFSRVGDKKVYENVKDSFLPYQPSGFTGSSLTRPVGVMLDYFNIPNKNWNKHKNSTFGERRLAFRNAFPNDVRLRDEDLYKGYRGRWAMRDWSS